MEYKWFIQNENLIDMAHELICRSQAIVHNYPSKTIHEVRDLNRNTDFYSFIKRRDVSYKFEQFEEDIDMSLKYSREKENRSVQDIITCKKFKDFVKREVEKHRSCIDCEYVNKTRKSLHRTENLKNTSKYSFTLYPGKNKSEKIIMHFLSYYMFVSDCAYSDSVHMLGQTILNEVFFEMIGDEIFSILNAVRKNDEEYKQQMESFDPNLYIEMLTEYLEFMLKISLEEVGHIEEMLSGKQMLAGIEEYILVYNQRQGIQKIPPYAISLFERLLFVGELKRGEVAKVISMSDRSASKLISQLLELGLIHSDSPKGKVRLKLRFGFPSHIVNTYRL